MSYASEQKNENVLSNFQDEHNGKTTIQKEKKHKCTYPDCHGIFTRPSKLERHMRQHTGERPYTCNEPGCTKSYASPWHLKRHSKTHDLIQTVYKCPQCSIITSNSCNLRRHYKEHGKNKVFCEECGKLFNKKYQLIKHLNTIHLKPTVYKCDKCDKVFMNISRLKRHAKNHEKSYTCPISGCSEVFSKWSLLRKHKAKHVQEYKCDKCNKVLRTKRLLKSHSKIHSEERMVMLCPYEECHRTYFYKSNLDEHIRTKHLGKKFYCDICSFGLTSKRKLMQHIKRHGETKKDNSIKSQRIRRKDTGIPKKSVIGTLMGWKFPHRIEKLLLKRETTINITESSDKSLNDEKNL